MNITAIIYDAAVRKTAYILGTVIGNCKLFPAERAPRDWSGYANVITVAAGEGGPVVTAGVQKRVTFRPKGEDETVAAAELIAKADGRAQGAHRRLSGRTQHARACDRLRQLGAVHPAGISARERRALHPH